MSTTDDTRQRSIPEILGWKCVNEPNEERWVHPTTGVAHYPDRGYTVDDMLTWLIAGGWVPESRYDLVNQRHTASVWQVGRTITRHHTESLHAALEAAVRAVAEVSGDE